jgi:hypothetical protein
MTLIDGFGALRSVGTQFSIDGARKLENLSFLAQLKNTHLTYFFLRDLDVLTNLDITGLNIDDLTIYNANAALTLKGGRVFDGKITLNSGRGLRFSGIEEVQSLTVSPVIVQEAGTVFDFPGLKKVNTISVNQGYNKNMSVMRFPDLNEVGGKMTLAEGTGQEVQPSEFPLLQKVNSLTYTGMISKLSLPALKEVTNELRISTSYTNGSYVGMLKEIYTPNLAAVGSLVLTTSAYNASGYNNALTNLDCFRNLERAEIIDIQKQPGLISYTGLKKAIDSLSDGSLWIVSENGYNPTYEQVKAGQLAKP